LITGTAPVNGVGLYYEISGEGQSLVLLHDGLLDGRVWDEGLPLARDLVVQPDAVYWCRSGDQGLTLRERDVDGHHHYRQDDAQDHQFSQDLTPLQYGIPTSFLEGVEPGVETARGDELVVGSFFGHPAVFEDQDLVDVFDQP
jgi:hypothetical protein